MAGPYHGKSGAIEVGGTALTSLMSWDFTTSIDVADTTAMGSVNSWETQLTGLSDFSGTAEGLSSAALDTAALLGVDASMQFAINNGGDDGQFEGNAVMTGITETVSTDDVGKIAYTFEGNDAQGLTFNASGTSASQVISTGLHGKTARVLFDSVPIARPREWSTALVTTTADSTAMAGTNNGRTRLAGFKGGTATWTAQMLGAGYADSAGTAIALGDSAVLQLWRTGTLSDGAYSGTAEITGMNTSTNKDGIVEATYTAKFDGAIEIATS